MGVVLQDIGKTFITKYNVLKVLEGISIEVRDSEFVCIIGPSGCGKTTLLNIIAGLEKATAGQVSVDGKPIEKPGPDRVVLFQEAALFPWLKVVDNVEFGMKNSGVPKNERRKRALGYLELVNMTKFQNSCIHELSGGMKQRVALARALAVDSRILIMDEPFASLDSITRNMLQGELRQIWQETGKTIIFVTHSIKEAVFLADRIIVMTKDPGRIKKEYTVNLERPRLIENMDFMRMTADILKELKDEVTQNANI